MKIYPHVVMEAMFDLRNNRQVFPDTFADAWPGYAKLLRQAVTFDFGEQSHSHEHVEFALDLYDRGLFALPYPVTAFSIIRDSAKMADRDGKPVKMPGLIVASMHEPQDGGGLSCFVCCPTQDPHGRINGAIPATIGFKGAVKDVDAEAATVDIEAYSVVTEDTMLKMFGDGKTMRLRLSQALLNAMGMTVMLMSKGVETILEPAPTRLNAARFKKDRPPINDRYLVRIAVEHARRIALEDGTETDISGHTRRSPRPHWRRGHFRTLEAGRVIPVAPAIIGTNDASIVHPVYALARKAGHDRRAAE